MSVAAALALVLPAFTIYNSTELYMGIQYCSTKKSAPVRAPVEYAFSDKIYLCASVDNVGKARDHEMVLALLYVPGLETCMHRRLENFWSQPV